MAPLSIGFCRQEYWSGLPFPSPGDLPDPEVEPMFPALQPYSFTTEPPGKPQCGLNNGNLFFSQFKRLDGSDFHFRWAFSPWIVDISFFVCPHMAFPLCASIFGGYFLCVPISSYKDISNSGFGFIQRASLYLYHLESLLSKYPDILRYWLLGFWHGILRECNATDWRRQWQPTSVLLLGKPHGWRAW